MAQALEEAENERDQKDKAFQENTTLGTEIYTLRRNLQVSMWIIICLILCKNLKKSVRDQIIMHLPVSQLFDES